MGKLATNLMLSAEPQKISFNDISWDSSLDRDHPNKLMFTGVLLLLDEPSQQPPHGAEGHAILVPKQAAEKALKSLIGMGINYKNDLEGHDPKKKIGVISEAWIDGNKVKVKGIIWTKDFPEAVAKLRANRGSLGMSMELGNVFVEDQDADVWTLEKFHFTGATVLKKESAAYQHTQLAASAQKLKVALAEVETAMGIPIGGKEAMPDKSVAKKQSKLLAQVVSASVSEALTKSGMPQIASALQTMNETNAKVLEFIKSSSENQKALLAARDGSDDDGADDGVELVLSDIFSAGKGDPSASNASSSSSMSAADASSSSSSSMSAANASDDDTSSSDATASDATASNVRAAEDPTAVDGGDPQVPTNRIVNKKASEHAKTQSKSGAKGQLTTGDGNGGVSAAQARKGAITVSAATAKLIHELHAQNTELKERVQKAENKNRKIEAQLERYAERVERRSLSPEAQNLLEKTGHNPAELMASGTKLSVGAVDEILEKSGLRLDPVTKMTLKNQFLQAGLMEQGIVTRRLN